MKDPLINVEAEACLLGALFSQNSLIDYACDRVSHDDFHEPLHGRIYAAIVRESALGKAVNPVTLKAYFEGDDAIKALGGVGYLARLSADMAGLLAPKEIVAQIAELAQRRRMRAGLSTAADACGDLDVTPAEIVAHADAAVAPNAQDSVFQASAADCIDDLLRSFSQDRHGVTCGIIPSLDDILGPLRPKQLVIGAGRPGMGKTAVALSYGLGAASGGHGVLFVSLEMSALELSARMVSDLCFNGEQGVPFAAIRDGELNAWQRNRAGEAANIARGMPFYIIDAGSLTIGRMNMLVRRHARRMAARGEKLELVIVDYLQLLHPDGRSKSAYESVSEVSRGLKVLAKDNGVAVLALAQLSREVEKRPGARPQLSDLRDSGQIEQDADAVMFLLRPEYYLRQNEPDVTSEKRAAWESAIDKEKDGIEFIVAKRRNGVTGSTSGKFYGFYQAVRG